MTQDEIIEMARQAGFKMENSAAIQAAEIFANLVAAKKQEPVADDFFRMIADRNPKPFPLPHRTWAGLTNEEIDAIYTGVRAVHHEIDSDVFARALEAYLKEKNT